MPQNQWPILALIAVFLLVNLVLLLLFARLFSAWLRAFLARASISLPTLILMSLRRSPVQEIVDAKIMAAQREIDIPVGRLESAALLGVDIKRAVLAVIRAKETRMEVSWDEIIAADLKERM